MNSANVLKTTANLPFQTNASAKTGKEEQESADFMKVLGSLAINGQSAQYKNQSSQNAMVVEKRNDSVTEYDKYSVKEDRIPEAVNQPDQAQMDKAQESLKEFTDEVQKQVEETFGVTKEQMEEAMSELGLTFVDLMNPTNLANLVMKLTGQEDSLGLLMNADFQELMKSVEVLSENLLQNLGMTAEEAGELMKHLEQNLMQAPEEALEMTQNPQPDAQTEENVVILQTKEEAVIVQETADPEQKDVQPGDNTVEETPKMAQEETAKEDVNNGQNQNSQDSMEDAETEKTTFRQTESIKNGRAATEETAMNPVQNPKAAEAPAANIDAVPQSTTVNVTDIIRQVSEFTRIMYQGNVTSMEMQLNPENLGKIYVQVTAKGGVITAQLAAQNEAVKEALESQVAVLKENMNQQGLKVEAVEVTIASHEFERNLEENQHNQSQEEQKEQTAKNTRRGISLNQLDELSGLMSEEEVLAAKIMRDNGNSVDFTA